MNRGIQHLMPVRVSTKRLPAVVGGKRGEATTYLTNVPSTPFLPVSAEVAVRLPDVSPKELLQCFIPGDFDVKEGDFLVQNGREYPVRDAAEWGLRDLNYIHLIVEDVKTQ